MLHSPLGEDQRERAWIGALPRSHI